jgi:hypothetical protein
MPWLPELFTAPTLQRILDERRRDALLAVPYFDGLMAGDPDPLVESFAGEPEVHDPLRGRIKGVAAFRAFVFETGAWLQDHRATVEDVDHVILERRGFEEVVVHLDRDAGPVDLPVAVVADRRPDGRIEELRVYFTSRPFTGRPANRPPVLQPQADLRLSDVVAAHVGALAAGDVAGVVASFEADGCARDSAGRRVHRGTDDLTAFYTSLLAHGGVPLETCAVVDDGRGCALEYNVVRRGAGLPARAAGMAVIARGSSGKLAAVRMYDDAAEPGSPGS